MTKDGKNNFETVLVMQGGGSVGAYECGVYKTLSKHNIRFDVVSGTSMGAINGCIICGSKNSNDVARSLEEFWMELSENTILEYLPDGIRSGYSFLNSAMWGIPKAFEPKFVFPYPWYHSWTQPYIFELKPLKKTLCNYVDFEKLNKKNGKRQRLIITSVDIQKGTKVVFDTYKTKIDVDHVLACVGYPVYGIAWTEKDGRYLWDGSLLSSTPFQEVISASPVRDKIVYMTNLFPKSNDVLPKNMAESWHRARDLLYTDKIDHSMKTYQIVSRHLILLKKLHHIANNANLDDSLKKQLRELEPEYQKLASKNGAIVKDIIKIERHENSHYIFGDADFSKKTIKQLIKQGQEDAELVLKNTI